MKIFMIFFLFFRTVIVCAQFQDSFLNGQFSELPNQSSIEWQGDIQEFITNEERMLQLNSNADKSPVQLRTPLTSVENTCWELYLQMDFTPSSSNYTKIYLASDEEDLCGELNGLFVRVGHSDKNICLIQSQNGKNNKILIKGEAKRLDHPTIQLDLKVTIDSSGSIRLYSKLNEENNFTLEGNYLLENVPVNKWFGIVCYFTTTRSKLFYFDDLSIKKMNEDEKPIIDPEPEDNYQYGDIILSEIMAHPKEEEPEYIELYNNSNQDINLKNYLFFYGDKSYSLPDKTIPSASYFLLTKNSMIHSFEDKIQVYGVNNFPTLANSGKLLMLKTISGKLISWFEYSDSMYQDEEKKKGGWSLECKDLNNLSNLTDNWTACVNEAGGTPGKENSVKRDNIDNQQPLINSVIPDNHKGIQITFSKSMQPLLLLDKESYYTEDKSYHITNLTTNFPHCTELHIELNKYPEIGTWVKLYLPSLEDLSGNKFENNFFISLGNDEDAQTGEVLINEILFNPNPDSNEYIEIVNNSNETLDLRFMSITSRKPSDGSFNKVYPLSRLPYSFHPGDYLVITQSKDRVCNIYNCHENSFFSEPDKMPSLANTGGCAVILNNLTNKIIDEFYYSETMHSPSISNKKGVALERISMELPTNDASNWLSASSQSGYGTPGYINSHQTQEASIKNNRITIEYPNLNNESYQINYKLDQAGYNCRIIIFDIIGRMVNNLINNEVLGKEGSIYWSGKAQGSSSLNAGIYILYVEIFDVQGNVYIFKLPAVVK